MKLICGDLRKTIMGDMVDLLITSPPYNCGKDYNSISDELSYEDYWSFTCGWVSSAYEALKSGGRMVVNLPWWMMKKPRRDVPGKFKQVAEMIGFKYLDKIIWIKGDEKNQNVSGGWGGGGSGWGTYMSPSGPAIRCASEPILVFAKEKRGRGRISGKGNGDCIKGDITKEEFLSWTIDVWFIRGEHDKMHPAVFPKEIPTRLIKLYTYPGETVMDPFMGSGRVGEACIETAREFIGIEKDPAFYQYAKSRIDGAKYNQSLDLIAKSRGKSANALFAKETL